MNRFKHFIMLFTASLLTVGLCSSCSDDDDTFYIYSAADLIEFQERVNEDEDITLNGVLMADVDLGGVEWTPIGVDYYAPYYATFNGNGFTISNLTISTGLSHQGLFGYVYDSEIKNVVLKNPQIEGSRYVGALCGKIYEESKISNCKVEGGSVLGSYYVGGLVGDAYYTDVKDCYNTSSVTGTGYNIGGVIGSISYYSEVDNCYNSGTITSSGDYTGGVIGYASDAEVMGCYNTGAVISSVNHVGGITGYSMAYVAACYNTGDVAGGSFVGGVVGSALQSYDSYTIAPYVVSCYNTGVVSGVSEVGGVVGRATLSANIYGCYYVNNYTLEGYNVDDGSFTFDDDDSYIYTASSEGAESLASISELNSKVEDMNSSITDFIITNEDELDIPYRYATGSPADSTAPTLYKY